MNTADWLDMIDFDVDEDPEILRAALDFIESCESSEGSDIELGEVFAVEDLLPSVDDAMADDHQMPRPAKRRNARKEEILELRKSVKILEDQLASTKRKMRLAPSQRFLTASNNDTDNGDVDTSAIWEEIAKRQQKQRYLAELENVKLRNMVNNQLKIAGDLTKVGKRQAFLQEHYEPMLSTTTEAMSIENASSSASASSATYTAQLPDLRSESPLLVTIFPKRSRLSMSATAAAEEMPKESWKSSVVSDVVRPERIQAVRVVAWQSMLRQFLNKRKLGYSYDRLGEVLDNAVSSPKNVLPQGLEKEYTERYNDDKETSKPATAWATSNVWQSPAKLLSALFTQPHAISLRLFQLPKARVSSIDDDIFEMKDTSAIRAASVRPSCLSRSMNDWQPRSTMASLPPSLCLRVL